MASKMAESNALKSYLTNKLDKKHLIWAFYGCLEAVLIFSTKIPPLKPYGPGSSMQYHATFFFIIYLFCKVH